MAGTIQFALTSPSLSEVDQAIRSTYTWYATCAAIVLDSDTPGRNIIPYT